jgi:hypothetical protein
VSSHVRAASAIRAATSRGYDVEIRKVLCSTNAIESLHAR